MLSPEYLEHLPDAFVRLFLGAENSVIEDMARRIVKTATLTDTAKWQYERLRAVNASYDYIMQQLERMTGQTEGELRGLFQNAGVEAVEYDNRIYRYAGLNPKSIEDSSLLQQQILTAYQNTQGVFKNLTRTTASAGQKQFIDALDRAALQLQSGAFAYTEVIPAAIRELAQSGLVAIRYPTGHVDRLDVATRRAVLTGVNQMAGKLSVAQADDMGCDLVETTAHAGARPSHQVWQGKVFSRSGNGRYPDFESSTGYGTGPGLCGWNCRHSFFPYFEGLSESAYPRQTLDEYNNRTVEYGGETMSYYDATQVQRGMERKVRATKRELAGYGAGIKDADEPLRNALKEKFNRSSVTLKRQEANLKAFTEKTGLDRQREREQVLGFGRSAAQKAVWSNKRVAIQRQNDILKEEIRFAGSLPKSAKIHLTPTPVNVKSLSFDERHINAERGHQVTREQAVQWIRDAKISVTVWGGQFERYYGADGTVYINALKNLVRTAYSKEEYDDNTRAILGVLKKYGL
jgi:hypothetical protein